MNVWSIWDDERIPERDKIQIIQKVYDNCCDSETVLFNAMSQIVEICSDRGSSKFEKIEEIMNLAFSTLERSKQIGLTNPDIHGSMNRKNSLAKQMKLARMEEKKRCQEY